MKFGNFFRQLINWLGKRNWGVMAGILFFLVFFEIFELLHKGEPLNDPFHLLEFLIFVFILALMGIMIESNIKANLAQKRTLEVLNYKHGLSHELSELDDWEVLIATIVELPGRIAPVQASRMHIVNPISGEMEDVVHWNEEGTKISIFRLDCQKCMNEHPRTNTLSKLHCSSFADQTAHQKEYCLSITSAKSLLALIQIQLKPDEDLTDEQKEILESLRSEIAWALKVAREQKILSNMQIAKITLAERHSLSTYLHDNLSQNLAYLRFKLEQFTGIDGSLSVEDGRLVLKHMKDAANQSYEIVRGIIESIHPETTPKLINLFRHHAKDVAERTHIKISIETKGNDLPIPIETQRAVFYVFQETLSNIEKHARADQVKVLLDWSVNNLIVTISDNGIGFDPPKIDASKHFGLAIMQERIEKVNGRIGICSSANSGTEVTLNVPVLSLQK